MAIALQIVIDANDPHALSRFWAEALGYEVEDHSGIVEQVLAAGHATEADTVVVDEKRGWKDYAACRDPAGAGPRLLFQRVPESKTVKNRVHLDLEVGEENIPAEVERLTKLGATKLWDGQLGPQTWVTMADPEGNEFCVA